MEWQPIETAPRDGSVILLAIEGGVGLETGYWRPDFNWEVDCDRPFDEDGFPHGRYVGAWTNGFQYADESSVEFRPTHWMPLPPPPQEG